MPVIRESPSKLFKTAKESEKPEKSEIIGSLPAWLRGTYLRVGPAKFDFEDEFSVNHWLDGYAMLSRFEINEGFVLFEKKYLQSDAYKRSLAANRPVINEFATVAHRDPNKGFFSRIISNLLPEFTDNDYSTLFRMGSDVFATCDTCFFRKIDPCSLSTDDKCDGSKLFGVNGQSAHPLVDSNGDMYNVGFSLLPAAKFSFIKMPKANTYKEMLKKSKTIATIPSRWSGAIAINHSIGMTESFLVFVEQPYVVSVSKIAGSLLRGETLKDWLEWRPQENNRFYIIDKATGKVHKTEIVSSEPFYFMHIINCFEENNQVVVDLITYKSPNVLDSLYLSNLRHHFNDEDKTDLSCVQRFIVPLISDIKDLEEGVNILKPSTGCSATRKGSQIILECNSITNRGIEMPTINQKFFGKNLRFVYAAGTFNRSEYSNTICKIDLNTKEIKKWKESDYLYPGEPMFVPNETSEDGEEDSGVVICAMTDSREGHDDLILFLDARNLIEIGRAKLTDIPSGLHGLFLPKYPKV